MEVRDQEVINTLSVTLSVVGSMRSSQKRDSLGFLLAAFSSIPVVSLMHMTQGIAMYASEETAGGTGLAQLLNVFGSRLVVSEILMLGVPIAFAAVFWPGLSGLIRYLMLLPQQVLILVSAAGAVEAIISGTYADGVVRSSYFIYGDQVYVVALAIIHTVASVARSYRP